MKGDFILWMHLKCKLNVELIHVIIGKTVIVMPMTWKLMPCTARTPIPVMIHVVQHSNHMMQDNYNLVSN